MGLDDLLIKKYAKKYVRNALEKVLKKPKKPITTTKQAADYIAENFEDIYEKMIMK